MSDQFASEAGFAAAFGKTDTNGALSELAGTPRACFVTDKRPSDKVVEMKTFPPSPFRNNLMFYRLHIPCYLCTLSALSGGDDAARLTRKPQA